MSDTWNAAPILPEAAPPVAAPDSWDAAPVVGPSAQQRAVVSADSNGDEAGKALAISKKTGIPASVVQTDIPGYDAHARQQEAKAAVENPYVAKYVDGNPMASQVSGDDYPKLDELSVHLQRLAQDQVNGKAQVGLIQGIPEMAALLGSAPGREKLFNALKAMPAAIGEGILDFFKTPGDVASGKIDLNTPEGLNKGISFGIGAALGSRDIQVGRTGAAPPPSGKYTTPDDFLGTLRGMETRAEMDAYLKSKAEADSPPGALLQIEKAKTASEGLTATIEAAQESKTKTRSPEVFEDFVAGHDAGNVHIDPNKIMELYQKEGKVPAPGDGLLGDMAPDLAAAVQRGIETGTEVTIPVSKYVAHVDPAVHDALHESVRLHDDGVSLEEAKETEASIEAWHGTPHDFEQFDLSKINTGEGAQVYGHGLYFAENGKVASSYQKSVSDKEFTRKIQELYSEFDDPTSATAEVLASDFFTDKQKQLIKALEKDDWLGFDYPHQAISAALRNPRNFDLSPETLKALEETGNLYKVSIKGDPQKFLDWDQPLTPEARAVFEKLGVDFSSNIIQEGGDAYLALAEKLKSGKKTTPDANGFYQFDDGRAAASKALAAEGIPGIKYLDQGSRRGPGGMNSAGVSLKEPTKTRNYVVFDDKLVKITEKNGKALAAEQAAEEVIKTKKSLFLNQLFTDAKSVGLTEPEFAKYSARIEAANEAMIRKSIERDVARRTAPEWKKNEAAIKADIERQFAEQGPYAARDFIEKNKVELTPENADALAPMFGYETGAEMTAAMKGLPDMAQAIKAEVATQMEARFGNRRANIQAEARELALSEDWHGILAEEVRTLAKAAGVEPALNATQLKDWAKREFEATNIVDAANWDKLRRAVEKGGREAEKALLKGDVLEAFKAKQRQMLAATLAKESLALQKVIDSTEKRIDKFQSDEVIASVDQAFTEQIRQVLASAGLPQRFAPLADTPTLRDFVAETEGQAAVAPWLMDGAQPKIQDMTVEQFRAFSDSIKSLEHVGRLAKTVENAQRKAEIDNIVFDVKKELERFNFVDQPLNPSITQRAASLGRKVTAVHLLVERMLDYTDRFDPHGPLTEFLDRPLRDANSKEIKLTEEVTKMLRDLKPLTDSSVNELIPNKVIPDAMAKPVWPSNQGYLQMNRGNLRQLMLNMGNETNIKKAVEGFNVSEGDLWELINSNATAKDWKWVQGVWDVFAYLKPEADAMQLRDTGVPVDSKVPRAIKNAHGDFAGGYYPIVYDRYNSNIQGTLAAKNPVFAPTYVSATTSHGYTQDVTGYKGALDLTGSFMATRIQSMIHDIAFREAIRNANKLISNQEFRTALAQHWGKEFSDLLPGWLRDIANSHTLDDNYSQGFARAVALVRQNVVSTLIAFNPGTVFKHGLTAALLSADRVGAGALAQATKDIGLKGAVKNAKDLLVRDERVSDADFMQSFRDSLDQGERGENARQFILDSSAVMRNRQRQYEDSIRGAVDAMNKAGTVKMLADWRQAAMLYGRLAVAYSDGMSAMPTWLAAYKKAYLAGETHADAVFIADKEVSRAHGSSFVGDQPLVTRIGNGVTGELMKSFVSLYKFWNHVVNNNIQLAWDMAAAVRGAKPGEMPEPGANAASIAKRIGIIMATIWIEEQASAALDEHKEGFLKQMAMASIRYFGGGIVGLREVTTALAHGNEPSTGMMGTVLKAGAQTARDIAKSTSPGATLSKDWLAHTATSIGILTGVGGTQAGKTGNFVKDWMSGRDVPKSFNQFRQGMRTGHTQPRKF